MYGVIDANISFFTVKYTCKQFKNKVVSPFCKFHIIHVADRNEYISDTLEYSLYLMQNMFNNTVM